MPWASQQSRPSRVAADAVPAAVAVTVSAPSMPSAGTGKRAKLKLAGLAVRAVARGVPGGGEQAGDVHGGHTAVAFALQPGAAEAFGEHAHGLAGDDVDSTGSVSASGPTSGSMPGTRASRLARAT